MLVRTATESEGAAWSKQAEIVMFVVRSSFIPEGMEPKPERQEPAVRMQGEVIAQSETNDVSLASALADLRVGKYRLVENFYVEGETTVGRKGMKTSFGLTYVFARDADGDRGGVLECFEMLMRSLWRVRVYKNPLFRDGQPVDGKFTLSINCVNRDPLRNDDGSPRMVWNDDRTKKVPLEPTTQLEIDGDNVSFVPVE